MSTIGGENPAELDAFFLGYRLDVISRWPSSERKLANARAISRRLTAIARSALVRPDIEDLLHLSCGLLDDVFTAAQPPGFDPCLNTTDASLAGRPSTVGPLDRLEMPLADW
ncbi:MAG TPA: hypothetical protein VMH80_06490 [Bryobacteraceae bacterium]|nr:hypothetical protein [Bryobacteraceae bacterium]